MLFFLRPSAAPAALVPLGTAACQSTGTLALTAPTQVPLGTAAAQSAGTLALTAPTRVPLSAAACQSAATLTVIAGAGVVGLAPAAATSTGTLALTAGPPIVVLQSADASSTGTLSLTAKTAVVLQASAGTSTGTLAVRIPAGLPGGKFVLTNVYVTIAGVDISRYTTQVEVNTEREPIDITPFGTQSHREWMGGQQTGTFTIDMFADPTITTPAFWTLLDSPVAVEVHPRGFSFGPTNPSWTATAIATKRVPLTGQVGEAAKVSIEFEATSDVLQTT